MSTEGVLADISPLVPTVQMTLVAALDTPALLPLFCMFLACLLILLLRREWPAWIGSGVLHTAPVLLAVVGPSAGLTTVNMASILFRSGVLVAGLARSGLRAAVAFIAAAECFFVSPVTIDWYITHRVVFAAGCWWFVPAASTPRRAAPGSSRRAYSATTDRVGRRRCEFDVVWELGRGGRGIVFEAVQTSLNRCVALKGTLAYSGHGYHRALTLL
ncbi:MAG: hypothetical protein U0798_17815 [Gemmataceae bacterium]